MAVPGITDDLPTYEISARSYLATKPAISYVEAFMSALQDPYDETTNPNGYVVLAIAENKLTYKHIILPKLLELHKSVNETDLMEKFPPFYGDMKGNPNFRKALSEFIAENLVTNKNYTLDYEKLIITNGCGPAVDLIAWTFCNPEEACIVPAPFYPAFKNDLFIKSRVALTPAYLEHCEKSNSWKLTVECLDVAYENALAQGQKPTAILITNPNNPLGICHTKEELTHALRWARRKKLTIISDEIYAKSCHSPHRDEVHGQFVSMIDIALDESGNGKVGSDVLILYGFSKDFCLSGLRVGAVYTENENFLRAAANLTYFATISSDTQMLLEKMLIDKEWVNSLHMANNCMLRKYVDRLIEILDENEIPYTIPTAALFVALDLRKFIIVENEAQITWKNEQELFETLFNDCKVLLTPGKACFFKNPGFFRCCYAFGSLDALEEGFKRITQRLSAGS